MRLLLDTHLLVWSKLDPDRLPRAARALIDDSGNEAVFSAASIWELAIKFSRPILAARNLDVRRLRDRLLSDGFVELTVSGAHAIVAGDLPHVHKDPFDRILVAQAMVEDMTLLTADRVLASYPGPILRV